MQQAMTEKQGPDGNFFYLPVAKYEDRFQLPRFTHTVQWVVFQLLQKCGHHVLHYLKNVFLTPQTFVPTNA